MLENTIFILVGMLLFVGLALDWLLLDRLKKKDPQIWKELGSPSLFVNNSMAMMNKVRRFKKGAEYKKLNDSTIHNIKGQTTVGPRPFCFYLVSPRGSDPFG